MLSMKYPRILHVLYGYTQKLNLAGYKPSYSLKYENYLHICSQVSKHTVNDHVFEHLMNLLKYISFVKHLNFNLSVAHLHA